MQKHLEGEGEKQLLWILTSGYFWMGLALVAQWPGMAAP